MNATDRKTTNASMTPRAADTTPGLSWAQKTHARIAADKQAQAKPKAAAASKEPHPCACGCGQMTKAVFAPGHDGQLTGAFLAIARGNADLTDAPEAIANLFGLWVMDRAENEAGHHPKLAELARQAA